VSTEGKIALEEHFYLPSYEAYGADGAALDGGHKAHTYLPDFFASVQKGMSQVNLRLEDMDRYGIESMVLSLTQPGIHGILDRKMAIDTAKRMNDELALILEAHPKRFLGFAAAGGSGGRARS
jgi:predicted TIM-barrel fold metal-dependent hydrolase